MDSHGLQMTLFYLLNSVSSSLPSCTSHKGCSLCLGPPPAWVLEPLDGSNYPCQTPGEGTRPSLAFIEQTAQSISHCPVCGDRHTRTAPPQEAAGRRRSSTHPWTARPLLRPSAPSAPPGLILQPGGAERLQELPCWGQWPSCISFLCQVIPMRFASPK